MARQLKRFTDEQIERANRVDVVEYAKSMGFEIKKSGNWYKAKGQGGLYFYRPANTWHWETEDAGGEGAISLCMKLENKTWVEAVRTLLNEDMEPIRYTREWKPEPEPPREFRLPDVNNTYKHMIAYLTKTRGIEPSVLKVMIDRKYVYENTQKSCVFVGRDKEGNAHHASVRSTNTTGKVFKQDVPGSQKAYSFNIPGDSGTLNVFEAPIDLLSYVSLQKLLGKQTRDSYLSLGGTTDKALERFLQDYPDIKKIRICTDNDKLLNESEWDTNILTNKAMFIRKNNVVKGAETELQMLFKTCNDYSRFIKRNPKADIYYVSLPKDKLHFSNNGELYVVEIDAEKQYTLYKSVKDFENGNGFFVSGQKLYLEHFFEMPAGEKAAVRIHEQYSNDYKVTRHRPTQKDFNEDLIVYKQQMQQKQEQAVENNIQDMQQEKTEVQEPKQISETGSEDYFIRGTCEVLIICDDPQEVDAYREIQIRVGKNSFGMDYEPNEYYLAYRDIEQVQKILQENSQITKIVMRTSRTPAGIDIADDVARHFDNVECDIARLPKLNRYSEDLVQMKVIETAIEQTPIEDMQVENAVGMEM